MIWCYLEKIYYAWEWHKNSKRRTSISMTIWFSSCSRIMVALKQVITLAEQQKSDRLVKMELPDKMWPLATLQQSSLITEGWIPGKNTRSLVLPYWRVCVCVGRGFQFHHQRHPKWHHYWPIQGGGMQGRAEGLSNLGNARKKKRVSCQDGLFYFHATIFCVKG